MNNKRYTFLIVLGLFLFLSFPSFGQEINSQKSINSKSNPEPEISIKSDQKDNISVEESGVRLEKKYIDKVEIPKENRNNIDFRAKKARLQYNAQAERSRNSIESYLENF